ncbi:Bug family tripartite tricarboxylate transporter substrate binding protein [Aquabacterium sp. J223]|uniref:Bug family tripartite tricarboxylate transporter substrate binding protein n=1 Tax=Aquabacterium sp. J223 TaxID=2898431 RepID=UPI0021AE1F67|nr:tripartite tricarboxylate transporter substrate binding protein [Aquabacterium sp. J223]UUX95005.1 tripartite tricarboxylate transporter substrate binding protein [Aquabacterium sp. J223]
MPDIKPIAIARRPLLLGTLLWAASGAAMAQPAYPEKPVRLVVPYAPGAAADQLGRAVSERLAQALGQPVVVDNRAGAGGTLGSDNVAKAAPDGYSIVLGTDASHATNIFVAKRFPYDPIKSFTPIAPAAINHIVLVVHPSLPVKSVAELIAYAKAHPNKLSFGSSGPGSAHHLAGELLKETAGIDMVHVAYKGGGPAMTDLLGNNIPMVFASMATARPHIDAGKVRALAVVEGKRFHGLPNLPTVGETVPGYAIESWFAFFGPAGMPPAVTARLNGEINRALAQPALREGLEKAGMSATGGKAEDLAAFLRTELARREKLVKAAGIEPE